MGRPHRCPEYFSVHGAKSRVLKARGFGVDAYRVERPVQTIRGDGDAKTGGADRCRHHHLPGDRLPRLGRLVYNAVAARDYPVIQGAVLLIAALFLLINLIVDLLYAVVDPRIRLA
jgi:Binding-protein-dependent transport system inner membrane component